MHTERTGFQKAAEEKKAAFQKIEKRQKRLEFLLERLCFAVLGAAWTAAGILFMFYGLGPLALLPFFPAAGFWAMLLAGYTAPLSVYGECPAALSPEERKKILEKIDVL